MKATLIGGMIGCIALCVDMALTGRSSLALGVALAGMALFGLAAERSRPAHWPRAEVERGGRRREGAGRVIIEAYRDEP